MGKQRNERTTKNMGLAASQARFLCITARKADCEYKSTDLAQQKLNITNQMSAISNDYANAMNATKLMWSNDTVDGDYGLTYSLLMMPSAVNDFNPYLITTPSGAVVLNNEYAAAAKAAGISKAGGLGSQEQRDKFIQALVPGGLVTQETADSITKYDYRTELKDGVLTIKNPDTVATDLVKVDWNPFAGVGAEPKNKSVVDAMQLPDLALSENFGQKPIDWSVLTLKDGEISQLAFDEQIAEYKTLTGLVQKKVDTDIVVNYIQKLYDAYRDKPQDHDKHEADDAYAARAAGTDDTSKNYLRYIEIAGKVADGTATDSEWSSLVKYLGDLKKDFEKEYPPEKRKQADETSFNFGSDKINVVGKYSVVVNNIISHDKGKVNDLTIGDLLTTNVVLVSNKVDKNGKEDLTAFQAQVEKMLDYIAEQFNSFDTDEASNKALKFAKAMTKRQFSREVALGANTSASLIENSAYQNAINYNGIGADKNGGYLAVSLSNMISAFLTYYDNGLNMADSDYVVGKSVEQSVYVTDNLNYYYLFQNDKGAVTKITDKSADFYDQLYNNILAHGWREDASIEDSEYLESMIKDGRYSMSSLNQDGYYYQTRYNDTGYLVEVSDTDAIARAEAEFTAKKAELTYKEDAIDVKTKKLDVEISALTQEYQSIQTMIQNGIQKAFQMFQS